MTWKYRGAVDHNGVHFHIWTAEDGGGLVFAITRTSVVEPQNPVVYRSIEELARRTGLGLAPASEADVPIELPPPPRPDRPFGIFRRPGGWVEVRQDGGSSPMPADIYIRDRLWPEYGRLPSESQYLAGKRPPDTAGSQ